MRSETSENRQEGIGSVTEVDLLLSAMFEENALLVPQVDLLLPVILQENALLLT